jgi:hypothetical protein
MTLRRTDGYSLLRNTLTGWCIDGNAEGRAYSNPCGTSDDANTNRFTHWR